MFYNFLSIKTDNEIFHIQDVVVPQMPRGDEDNLKDDLAVSDESEDEDKKPNISSDDALAF